MMPHPRPKELSPRERSEARRFEAAILSTNWNEGQARRPFPSGDHSLLDDRAWTQAAAVSFRRGSARLFSARTSRPAWLLQNRRRRRGVRRRIDRIAPRFDLPAAATAAQHQRPPPPLRLTFRTVGQPELPFSVGNGDRRREASDVVQLKRVHRTPVFLLPEQLQSILLDRLGSA